MVRALSRQHWRVNGLARAPCDCNSTVREPYLLSVPYEIFPLHTQNLDCAPAPQRSSPTSPQLPPLSVHTTEAQLHTMELDSKLAGAPATSEMPHAINTAPEFSEPSKLPEAKTSSKIAGISVSQQNQDRQHSKAKQALPHIAVLFTGIMFFTLSLALLGVGLRLVSVGLNSDLQRAQLALRGHSNVRYTEHLLYNRLDEVTSTPLAARFMEKHEDCLVRGMNHVDQQLFGMGLQYPDIRNQTIDWTVENCGRLHHTLQSVLPSIQQGDLTYWSRAFHQGSHLSARAREAVLVILRPLESFLSPYQAQLRKSMTSLSLRIPRRLGAIKKIVSVRPASKRATMPEGFALECEGSLCRIVFTEPSVEGTLYNRTSIPAETIVKTARKVSALHKAYVALDTLKKIAFFGLSLFMPLQFSLLLWYSVIKIYSESFKSVCGKLDTHLRRFAYATIDSVRGLTIKERLAAVVAGIMVPLMYIALLPWAQPSEQELRIAVDAGLVMLLLIPLTIDPSASKMDNASPSAMFKAFMGLHRIIFSADPSSVEARVLTAQEKDQVDEHAAMVRALLHALTGTELESRNLSSVGGQGQKFDPLPTYPYQNFPIESYSEDEDQTNEYDTEFETESESDVDEIVDLAGGIRPTTVEDSDWSVVDA